MGTFSAKIRGGRMTKWKGTVASIAPFVGVFVLAAPQVASAGTCAETAFGSRVFNCTGPAGSSEPTQDIAIYGSTSPVTISLTELQAGFGLNSTAIGIRYYADGTGDTSGGQNVVKSSVSSSVVAGENAIQATGFGAFIDSPEQITFNLNGSLIGGRSDVTASALKVYHMGAAATVNLAESGYIKGSSAGVESRYPGYSGGWMILNNDGDIEGDGDGSAGFLFSTDSLIADQSAFSVEINNHSTGRIEGVSHGILTKTVAADQIVKVTVDGGIVKGGTVAIEDKDGLATVAVSGAATQVSGSILLGNGSDSLTFSNGVSLGDITLLDGGDNVSASDGMVDTLTYSGMTHGLTGAKVVNWENVVVDGGRITILDGALVTGSEANTGLTVKNGGVLALGSGLNLTGNLNNDATVTSVDGAADDVVKVSGAYTGGGRLELDTVLGNDGSASDILVVQGDTAGTTTLAVTNVGGTGAQTDQGILVVQVAGASNGTFVLEGGPKVVNGWSYDLLKKGNNWYLVSTAVPVVPPAKPQPNIYEALPAVAQAGFARLPTLEQRVGQRQWWGRDIPEVGVIAPRDGAWIRLWGDKVDINPGSSTSGVSATARSWGLQAGYDKALDPGDKGQWVVGLTGQLGQVDANVRTNLGTGAIDAKGFGLGATATWYGNNGVYFDAQAQVNRVKAEVSFGPDLLASNVGMTAYALSGELGYRHKLDENSALVPQAQLMWSQVTGSAFTDAKGSAVSFGPSKRLTGRLGIAYEYEYSRGWLLGDRKTSPHEQHREKIYVIGNILHDFSNESSVSVNGANLSQSDTRTWGEIGAGGSIVWDENKTLYTEGSYRKALGGNASDGLHLTVGFRMQF